MIPDLKSKVVLVTGASTGIGASVARAFGAEGSTVVVHYHSSEAAAREVVAAIEADGGRAHALRADATHPEQMASLVKTTVERYGRLDVLINNVGDLVRQRRRLGRIAEVQPHLARQRVGQERAAGHEGEVPAHAVERQRQDDQHVIAARREPGGRPATPCRWPPAGR